MIVAAADHNQSNRGRSQFHSVLSSGSSNNLYSRESRRGLRNARARRASAERIESPHRSLSADFQFALQDPKSSGNVTLDTKKSNNENGELHGSLSRRSSSKSKMTLDELFQSHHSRKERRRQRLMARNGKRFELRKSLSYGQMQDLTRSFSRSSILGLNESLHDIQRQRQPELLGAKLANMFEVAVKESSPGNSARLVPRVRKLLLGLSVETMVEIVEHLDHCQTQKEPIQWDYLQSRIDPAKTVDWDREVLMQLKKAPSQASGFDRTSEHGDSHYEEISYESLSYYEEELLSVGSSQSSYIHTDDGQNYQPIDLTDDGSQMTGYSLEAYTEHCNSSITFGDCASLCDPDESFALDGLASNHRVVLDMPQDFDSSVYTEVVEEIIEEAMEDMEMGEWEEPSAAGKEMVTSELVEDAGTQPTESESKDTQIHSNVIISLTQERTEDLATATEELGQKKMIIGLRELESLRSTPKHYDGNQDGLFGVSKPVVRLPSTRKKMAERKSGFLRSNPPNPSKPRNRMESKSFRALQQSKKVSSLIARFEMGCKTS